VRGRLSTKKITERLAQEEGIDKRGRRTPKASRVVELWPKMFPRLSRVVEIRGRGQERRPAYQRSERFWPPRLATPRGGRGSVSGDGKTPAAASDQKQRDEKGGPWGGGWMGRPIDSWESM
jgi:hypothetical protein